MLDLGPLIRDIPDFPKKGILFKDITTLLKNPRAFKQSIDQLTDLVRAHDPSIVIGMESRGFIFAAPIAYQLDAGFVPVRKLGKLPGEVISAEYELEYGTNTLELDRKSTRLNSSHTVISYAVFCLKKKQPVGHAAVPADELRTV